MTEKPQPPNGTSDKTTSSRTAKPTPPPVVADDGLFEEVVRVRGKHPVRARWRDDAPTRRRNFAKLIRAACDPAVSADAFSELVWRQDSRKVLPIRLVEGDRVHPVGLIRRIGGDTSLRGALRRLANGEPFAPDPPPPSKTIEELEAMWAQQPPPHYMGEWKTERPGCREALERLRAAANDPRVTIEKFAQMVGEMEQAGTMPDRLVLPDGSGFDVEFVMGLSGEEVVWDLLRETRRPSP